MVWNSVHTDIVSGGQIIDKLYNKFAICRNSILYKTIMQLWKKYHLHDISDIPAEDKELIDLLFLIKAEKRLKGF